MARSKFRLFHLILEICKSRFFAHPVHVVTYTFRKNVGGGLEEFCGDPSGSHIWYLVLWRLVYPALPVRLLVAGDFVGCRVVCQRTIPTVMN